MKKIVLLGDSIRMGYDKYVREALAGAVEVFYPDENCRYAENLLRFAHEWKKKNGWGDDVDLVHWNAGLWDVLELFDDEPLTTKDYYANVIPRIDRRLRLIFPSAKIVFATSTPIIEEKCASHFKRKNATIEEYNAIALDSLSGTDTVINDLYSLMKDAPDSYHSDAVHFYTDEGTELIGKRVLSVICAELGIDSKDVRLDSFSPENYTKDNIGY